MPLSEYARKSAVPMSPVPIWARNTGICWKVRLAASAEAAEQQSYIRIGSGWAISLETIAVFLTAAPATRTIHFGHILTRDLNSWQKKGGPWTAFFKTCSLKIKGWLGRRRRCQQQ